MLKGFRALDVTGYQGYLSGRILADLGVDVIKVEPPGGDPGRRLGPFYNNEPHPEHSLFWFAYNLGKRSITLELGSPEGREIFETLARSADFVIESFPPGYMEGLGLDYSCLRQVNPGIIFASISPFGQDGPYRDYKGYDIVAMAMGGFMYLTGDPDRPPLRIGFPIAYVLASLHAVLGSLIALYHRQHTRLGQHVDVSMQEGVVNTLISALPYWELNRLLTKRVGAFWFRGGLGQGTRQRILWPCHGGTVATMLVGGPAGVRSNQALVKWMEEEGMADDFLCSIDWDAFDIGTTSDEFHRQIEERIGRFFMTRTKNELNEEAQKRGIFLQFVATPKDIVESRQLAARDFWVDIPHPELGTSIAYPGRFAKVSLAPLRFGPRAPLIGEHNQDIYRGELGFSQARLTELKERQII